MPQLGHTCYLVLLSSKVTSVHWTTSPSQVHHKSQFRVPWKLNVSNCWRCFLRLCFLKFFNAARSNTHWIQHRVIMCHLSLRWVTLSDLFTSDLPSATCSDSNSSKLNLTNRKYVSLSVVFRKWSELNRLFQVPVDQWLISDQLFICSGVIMSVCSGSTESCLMWASDVFGTNFYTWGLIKWSVCVYR